MRQTTIFILSTFVLSLILLGGCDRLKSTNQVPVADAGVDQAVAVGDDVYLNGMGSVDEDGRIIRFEWELIEKPSNSLTILSDPANVAPMFIADTPGTYIIRLQVFDGDALSSPDEVHVVTLNSPPTALAELVSGGGAPGVIAQLDGSLSFDEDQDPLVYDWSLISKPPNSLSEIEIDDLTVPAISVTVTPDKEGDYVVHLVVNDGWHYSDPAIIVFSAGNTKPPIAEAGKDQALFTVGVAQLDGTQSYDPDGSPLSYRWDLLFKPLSSEIFLDDDVIDKPTFVLDVKAAYVARLVVNDGSSDSHPDTVIVAYHPTGPLCQDCHDSENASGKSLTHVTTYDDCDFCHNANRWNPVEGFVHMASPGVCKNCHDGRSAAGKQDNHVVTELDCDWCHRLEAWLPIIEPPTRPVFSHELILGGCFSCHSGLIETGKSEIHSPSSNRCSACHRTSSWLPAVHLEHTIIFDECILCHNVENNNGKLDTHLPTSDDCVQCHHPSGWKPVLRVNHDFVIGECVDCHDGEKAQGKSLNHPETSDKCEACHTTISWSDRLNLVDHSKLVDKNCVRCHNGTRAIAKKQGHLPTTNNCSACHATNSWLPLIKVDHLSVRGNCESCHNGDVAEGKPSDHIRANDRCAACHTSQQWFPVNNVDHLEVLGACADCHIQPTSHINTSKQCQACHDTSRFLPPGTVDHNEVSGTCVSCHQPHIPANHSAINVIDKCSDCHSVISWQDASNPLPTSSPKLKLMIFPDGKGNGFVDGVKYD